MRTEQTYKNKVVLVTGSGFGIGRTIAKAFAQAGAHVIICGKDKDKGKKVVGEIKQAGFIAEQIIIDLSKSGAAEKVLRRVSSKHKRLDVLVNNAKFNPRRNFLEETEATWEEGLAVSLKAVFFLSQQAIKKMKETGGGQIINIGSVAGFFVGDDSVTYHVAKAGLAHLTKYLGVHAAPYNVRVNAVAPGFIIKDEYIEKFTAAKNTAYRKIANAAHPVLRTGTAQEVADVVLFLASNKASYIVGQTIVVDGGLTLQNQNEVAFHLSKQV